jgi:hypothetical protein
MSLVGVILALHIWNQNHLNRVLRQHVNISLVDADLIELVEYFSSGFDLEIVVSQAALPESAKNNLSFTCNLADVELGTSLRMILNQQALDFVVDEDVLVIVVEAERRTLLPSGSDVTHVDEIQEDTTSQETNPFSEDAPNR